ncbi:MAG: hypothetical protein EA405_05465 [Rhodospirillales bacterium]|nr:MAG: hypothetical protein EA405_05465 [Rhodospirillales bacterium]
MRILSALAPQGLHKRLRLLPLVVVAASLALAVKLTHVGDGLYDIIQPAMAASEPTPPKPPAETPAQPTAEAPGSTGGDGAAPAAEGARPPGFQPPPERSRPSDAELEVLQQLTERRRALEARERALEEQQALIQAAEMRLDRKVEELRAMQDMLEGLIQTREEQEDKKLASLVKIYENMRPKDAARIFEQLEMDTLLLVADRMRERSLAPIMAQMNPRKAKDVTVELAQLRALPQPWANAEGS